jgi:choline dehydrogenase-like flavoprotein
MYRHHIAVSALGESLPNDSNLVTIDPVVKDRFGIPAARMTHAGTERDYAVKDHQIKTCTEILEAAGAKRLFPVRRGSGHLLGTCRMGHDPKRSVVNRYGQTHDVKNLYVADASIFVTGSSFNPTLTIVALANWIADHFIEERKRS